MKALQINLGSTTDRNNIYLEYLKANQSEKPFCKPIIRRIKHNDTDACFEATVFGILKYFQMQVDPCATGPDFFCGSTQGNLYCEAKFINTKAVVDRSGVQEASTGGSYERPTETIFNAVKKATKKFGKCNGPRVVFIGSNHSHSGLFFEAGVVTELLTSQVKLVIPINQFAKTREIRHQTDLRHSMAVKLEEKNGRFEVIEVRESISAVILVNAADENVVYLRGALHPEPAKPLIPAIFPKLPFVAFQEMPSVGKIAKTHWINV
ncbi:MAG: hypothetical protein AB1439_12200 [candidate division FCPU426 bacterium]